MYIFFIAIILLTHDIKAAQKQVAPQAEIKRSASASQLVQTEHELNQVTDQALQELNQQHLEVEHAEQEQEDLENNSSEESEEDDSQKKAIGAIAALSVPAGISWMFIVQNLPFTFRQRTRFDPVTIMTGTMAAKYIAASLGSLLVLWYLKRSISNLVYGQYQEREKNLKEKQKEQLKKQKESDRAKRKAQQEKYKKLLNSLKEKLQSDAKQRDHEMQKQLDQLQKDVQKTLALFSEEHKRQVDSAASAVQDLRAGVTDLNAAKTKISELQAGNAQVKELLQAKIMPAVALMQHTVTTLKERAKDDLALAENSKPGTWRKLVVATRPLRQSLGVAKSQKESSSDRKDGGIKQADERSLSLTPLSGAA